VPEPTGSGATRSLRIAFLGNDAWSVPSLEALAGSAHEVELVETAAPKPAGRGNAPTPTAVAAAARSLHLPLAEIETVRSGAGFDLLLEAHPDVLAVVAYGELLPAKVLEVPAIAPVNLHFSLPSALWCVSPAARSCRADGPECDHGDGRGPTPPGPLQRRSRWLPRHADARGRSPRSK
jgi:methionyl-tRNA formyltransferase